MFFFIKELPVINQKSIKSILTNKKLFFYIVTVNCNLSFIIYTRLTRYSKFFLLPASRMHFAKFINKKLSG